MTSLLRRAALGALLLVVAGATVSATAASAAYVASKPAAKTLYHDGPSGRYLLNGAWLFRLDPTDKGVSQGLPTSASVTGWKTVTVPNAWNTGDPSAASMTGGVGWYRKDFKLPSASSALQWVLRFESANYRAQAWLNGKPIGSHVGAFLAFELRISPSILHRTGVNRLVVRVDSRHGPGDFPPSTFTVTGDPTGGWWNYSGLTREVYLRSVNTADFTTVAVTPKLPCSSCTADVNYKVTMTNVEAHAIKLGLKGKFGSQTVDLGTQTVPAHRTATFVKTLKVPKPRLWSPKNPRLYDAPLTATVDGKTVASYALTTGIRSIVVYKGRLYLNGNALNFRGVGLHEADQQLGGAIDNAVRDKQLADVKDLGATLIRSHYPLHPYVQEQADKLGILVWSEVPVYEMRTEEIAKPAVVDAAVKMLQDNVETNENHPSVIVWSVGNELATTPGPAQARYFQAATAAVRAIDPTRPVGYEVAGYPTAGCQTEYAPLDILGFNEYFGWYTGPGGQVADEALLPDYLDSLRACYPTKAIAVTEFGAEANRAGPAEEKGTYAFQQAYVNYHLGVFASKTWLSGAVYWALQEFWVRPGWDGGNPYPTPPVHTKGLISYAGVKKPAWTDVQKSYQATQQYPAAAGPAAPPAAAPPAPVPGTPGASAR